jgi:hypothetical protein
LDSKVIFQDKDKASYERGNKYSAIINEIFEPIVIAKSDIIFSFDKKMNNSVFNYIDEK